MVGLLQIHAPNWGFTLGVHINNLECLLTIDGCFYRLLVLSPERNWSTMATSQLQNCESFGHMYVPSETSLYCNTTKQALPKLTPERPFSWQQLWGRFFGKAWTLIGQLSDFCIIEQIEMMWHQLLHCLKKERAGHSTAQCDVKNCGYEMQALETREALTIFVHGEAQNGAGSQLGPLAATVK